MVFSGPQSSPRFAEARDGYGKVIVGGKKEKIEKGIVASQKHSANCGRESRERIRTSPSKLPPPRRDILHPRPSNGPVFLRLAGPGSNSPALTPEDKLFDRGSSLSSISPPAYGFPMTFCDAHVRMGIISCTIRPHSDLQAFVQTLQPWSSEIRRLCQLAATTLGESRFHFHAAFIGRKRELHFASPISPGYCRKASSIHLLLSPQGFIRHCTRPLWYPASLWRCYRFTFIMSSQRLERHHNSNRHVIYNPASISTSRCHR
ncbi:hypothetical protein C8J56DRAFT_113572 [Mycena floridula]|nr:hypothetical protein C8J56DRAFT_113572 [Mycena floridula]